MSTSDEERLEEITKYMKKVEAQLAKLSGTELVATWKELFGTLTLLSFEQTFREFKHRGEELEPEERVLFLGAITFVHAARKAAKHTTSSAECQDNEGC